VALPGLYRAEHVQVSFQAVERPESMEVGTDSSLEVIQFMEKVARVSPDFVLQMGAGVVVSTSGHLALRAEFNRLIYSFPAAEVAGSSEYAFAGGLGGSWDLNVGMTYRSGTSLRPVREVPVAGRWTIGPQAGYTFATGPVVAGTVGLFASYRLAKYCDFDTRVSTFVRDAITPTGFEGGGIAQALAGIKLGVRTGRFAAFFKARTGVNSYSKSFNVGGEPDSPFFVRNGAGTRSWRCRRSLCIAGAVRAGRRWRDAVVLSHR